MEGTILRITKKAVVGSVAVLAAVGGGLLVSSSANATTTAPVITPGVNTVGSPQVKDNSLYQSDFNQDVINKVFRVPGMGSVTSWSVKDGALTEADLSADLKAKVNAVGDGVSGLSVDGPIKTVKTGFSEIKLTCPEGKKAISGGLKWDSGTGSSAKDVFLNASYPSDLTGAAGARTSTSWTLALTSVAENDMDVTVQPFITCVNAG
jgi:hypothetical protein